MKPDHLETVVHYCSYYHFDRIINKELGIIPGFYAPGGEWKTLFSACDGSASTRDYDTQKKTKYANEWPGEDSDGSARPLEVPFKPRSMSGKYAIYCDVKAMWLMDIPLVQT